MERTINALISFDDAGREIVDKARERQRGELANMNEYKRAMYQRHLDHLQKNLEKFSEQAAADQEDSLLALRKRHDEQLGKLREAFLRSNKQWVAQMVADCTGRG